jgi:hypothetical protein
LRSTLTSLASPTSSASTSTTPRRTPDIGDAAGAIVLLPGPSALTIVVVAVLALAAIAVAEILAAPPQAPVA